MDDTRPHSPTIARALGAFDAALEEATEDGLRDLHEALQTSRFAIPAGKARLVRGTWGTLGAGMARDEFSGCPLNALFIREAEESRGGLPRARQLARTGMGRHGYRPRDFYLVWDAGHLSPSDLRERVERHLTDRLNRS